jgi:catechol 2,3-dioxygenase-like lactoylglutathione lyase family enzyme
MVQQRNVGVGPVDHVGVVVADLKAAAAEFRPRLGLRVDANEVAEAVGVRLDYLVAPGPSDQCPVQLVEQDRDEPIATFLEGHGESAHHVCFTSRTLGEPQDGLGNKKATVFVGGKGPGACFLTDRLSGILVDLVEPLGPANGSER